MHAPEYSSHEERVLARSTAYTCCRAAPAPPCRDCSGVSLAVLLPCVLVPLGATLCCAALLLRACLARRRRRRHDKQRGGAVGGALGGDDAGKNPARRQNSKTRPKL